MKHTLILSGKNVSELVRIVGIDKLMDKVIDRLGATFETFDDSAYEIPARTGFHYTEPAVGLVEWMPVIEHRGKILMKLVGYHPSNPFERNLPTILSTLAVFNKESGSLDAIIDGTIATALRTGAASAVATKLMAKSDSRTLGLVGCGAQSVTQLHALSRVMDIQEVLLFDINPKAMASFPSRVAPLEISAKSIQSSSLANVIRKSDVLCIATSVDIGKGPVFSSELTTKPWVHINAIGSDLPGKTELPLAFLQSSFVCPDFREQAVKEGECQQLEPHEIQPDILHLIQRRTTLPNLHNRRTVFDSTGFAIEDYVVMTLLCEMAETYGIGTHLEIEFTPDDPLNPYEFLS